MPELLLIRFQAHKITLWDDLTMLKRAGGKPLTGVFQGSCY